MFGAYVDPDDYYDLDDMDDDYVENSNRLKRIKESKYKPTGSMSSQQKRMEVNNFYANESKKIKRMRRNSIRYKGEDL